MKRVTALCVFALAMSPAIAHAGPTAYIPNWGPGQATAPSGGAGTADDTVTVIDTDLATPPISITVQDKPYDVARHPTQPYVYVVNQGVEDNVVKQISVIDTTTNTVVDEEDVGLVPYGIAFDETGDFAYVTNRRGDTITVFDTAAGVATPYDTIDLNAEMSAAGFPCNGKPKDDPNPIFCGPKGIAVNGNSLYVTNFFDDTIARLDVTLPTTGFPTYDVLNVVNLAVACPPGPPCVGPRAIVMSPAHSAFYVANREVDTISRIDTNTHTVSATISLAVPGGSATTPRGLTLDPDGNFLYVANFEADNITVIDTSINQVVAGPPFFANPTAGSGPFGIAFTGTDVWVTNFTSGDVTILDTLTNTSTTVAIPPLNRPAGLSPFWIVP